MDLFDGLTLIGGLSLFLFGMNIMGQALQRRAGNSLKQILGRLTDNKLVGFATGLAVTAVIQSSSATTVMVVGFVNSGLMTLRQSMSLIMGANVGTTITAWILSLSGISGGNFVLQLLKPSSFTPVLALIGVIKLMGAKNSKGKDTGTILLGFATLMFGLETMSGAVSAIKDVPEFRHMMLTFENPFLGLVAGAVITAMIQSSSASVGILQSLSMTGLVSYEIAIPIIMGMNIGACVPTLISSVGANTNAKRAAMFHLAFNIIGAVFWLIVYMVIRMVVAPAILLEASNPFGIAIVHTTFKLLCVALLMPMDGLLEKLVCRLVKETSKPQVVELDERLMKTPAVALDRCRVLMNDLAKVAKDSMKDSIDSIGNYEEATETKIRKMEDQTDHYEDIIGSYLVKLSSLKIDEDQSMTAAAYLKLIADFERIADHSVNIVVSAGEMKQKGISFSEDAENEVATVSRAIKDIIQLAYDAFVNNNLDAAFKVEPLEQVVDYLKEEIRTRHIRRLQTGGCSIEAGFILNDILASMERVSDHCSNIAGCIIDSGMHNLNLHQTLNDYKHNSEKFNRTYEQFMEEYRFA